MNEMKISVIIPAYNAADTIEGTVASLRAQNFDGMEIIIVDDGSMDTTAAVCRSLASSTEGIRLLTKENGGVSSARNAGLDVACGEYVMFVDADDILRPGALSCMYVPGMDLIAGGFEKVCGNQVTYSCIPSDEGEYDGAAAICTFLDAMISRRDCYLLNSSCFKLYRRTLLEESGLRFDESLHYGEDKMFVMNFLCHVEKVKAVKSVIYTYVTRGGSLSSDESSDRHLERLFALMEAYHPVLERLCGRFGQSVRLSELYHTDMIGRYVFRILTQFIKRRSSLLTRENIETLYRYMSQDRKLGLFNVRIAQIPNILLYMIGRPSFSEKVYRLISRR